MNFRQYAGTPGNSRRASRCQQWIALCAVHVFAKAAALAFATSGSLSQKRRFSGDARRRAGCALASPKSLPKTHSRRLPLETPRTRRVSRDRTVARSPGTAASGRDLPVAKCLSGPPPVFVQSPSIVGSLTILYELARIGSTRQGGMAFNRASRPHRKGLVYRSSGRC